MADGRLRIEVLGPIRVLDPAGGDITPDGALQRRLLALLVLCRGRTVSADRAIDALWLGDAPRDPTAALQNQVFRLRRRLPDGAIQSSADGYRLDPACADVDADLLGAAVQRGDVDAVLERWHGPAYPELADTDDGRAEALRLDELRIRAREVRAERRLADGDVDAAVTELTSLADDEPLRERPVALLMDALSRAGRTAEALRVFDDFRRRLGDELGIDPSPSLTAAHASLLSGTAPAAAPPSVASPVPIPVTSLVGREALLADVLAAVRTHRLVTLLGPGGVGKTRLLVEVGGRLQHADEGSVVFCELGSAVPDTAVDAVAASLGIDGRLGVDLTERVATVLGDAEVVLLLDNCEHVLDPIAAVVERVLSTCPAVRIVTTSRERLRVASERLCAVPTLAAGSEDAAAVQLFVERARAVVPTFDPTPEDLAAIVDIVGQLDGLPLAIELAAARLHTLDLGELADGLDRSLDLLSAGYRTSSRHRSLRAALSWSIDLLDVPLQHLLGDLSTFAGSFTLADAAAVHGSGLAETAAAIDQLVERSLVARAATRRYVLLETVRAFGAEQAAAAGRAGGARERHARHIVDWVSDADRRLLVESHVLTEIDAALPELRAAFGWLLDHDEIDLAGQLIVSLRDYGLLRLRPDVLVWSERVVDADPDAASPNSARVLAVAAYAAWMAGDITENGARCDRALRAAEAHGAMAAEVATVVGNHALFEGRLADAGTWYARAMDLAVDNPAKRLLAWSTSLLALAYANDPRGDEAADALLAEVGDARTPYAAYVWFCAGEVDLVADRARARMRLARAIEIAEETNATFVVGTAGASKASIDARDGDAQAAAADYRRLLVHWRRAGMWSTQWTMLRSICVLLARLARWADAAVLVGAVRSTTAGHRIFGADEAALAELGRRLRDELGDEVYEARLRDGAALDGDAAVEHALRCL